MSDLTSSGHNAEQISNAVDEFFRLQELGTSPDISQFVGRYPEIADELRRLLPALAIFRSSNDQAEADQPDRIETSQPLGDYQLIREVGRGGMGIVYEARQMSLSRRVAIKILPFAATLDEQRIKRFRNESLAVASVDHPNIVDVYGVGCERGIHYYVMRYVEGSSLNEIIESMREVQSVQAAEAADVDIETVRHSQATTQELAKDLQQLETSLEKSRSSFGTGQPQFFRRAATVFHQIANALEHAHRQGIIHRDIKPSNLMIDIAGKPWITDFGLAQVSSLETVTLTGDIVGTLRYMSPEQISADEPVDYRADIYSLGATLYELLTLHPMFTGKSRIDIIRRIREENPTRPRLINAAIPIELETIVAKATEKEATNRYASAAAFAHDLQLWLDGKPITARPITSAARAWRWCKRSPLVAGLLLAVSLLSLVVATISLVTARRMELQRNQIALQRDDMQRTRNQALDVIETMTSIDALESYAAHERLDEKQISFLSQAASLYQSFSVETDTSAAGLERRALACGQMGKLCFLLERNIEARQSFLQAIEIEKQLKDLHPDTLRFQLQLADSSFWQGRILQNTGELDAAESSFRQALDIHEQLDKLAMSTSESRLAHLLCIERLGNLSHIRGDYRHAIELFQQALAKCQKIPLESNSSSMDRVRFSIHHSTGLSQAGLENWQAACDAYDQGIQIGQRLEDQGYLDRELRSRLANVHSVNAVAFRHLSRYEDAEQRYLTSLTILNALVADYPAYPAYRTSLSSALNNYAVLLIKLERLPEAESHIQRSIQLLEKLIDEHPEVINVHVDLVGAYSNIGKLNQSLGHLSEALLWFDKAIASAGEILARSPNLDRAILFQRNSTWARAETLDKLDRHAEARVAWEEARDMDRRNSLDIRAGQALNRALLKDFDYALTEAQRMLDSPTNDADVLFDIARIYALAAGQSAETESTAHYEALAVDQLRRAIDGGYNQLHNIFEPKWFPAKIQNSREYLKLIARYVPRRILSVGGTIDVGKNGRSQEIARLADLPNDPDLKILWIMTPRCKQVDDHLIEQLRGLDDLAGIDLYDTSITDATAVALSQMPSLQQVYVHATRITDFGAAAIAALPRLQAVNFNWTRVGDSAAEELSNQENLQSVRMRGTSITDAGVKHLAALRHLQVLDLGENNIGDESLAWIAGQLISVRELEIDRTQVSDQALSALVAWPLRRLRCSMGGKITQAGLDAFSRQHPECLIQLE